MCARSELAGVGTGGETKASTFDKVWGDSTPYSLAKLPHRGSENATVPPRQGFTHQTAIIRGDFQGVTSSTEEAWTRGA